MALDRPDEDGAGDARPERVTQDHSDADAPVARAELAEPRTRAEY